MALKSESLSKASNEGINNDAIITSGEDLEDGEIFDDEAEPEEKSEPEIAKNNAKAAVEIQKSSPASNSVAPVAKTVLKNDTHNVSEKVEKKNDRFSAQPRWTEENNYGKKEEVKKNREQFDNEKRFKERKLKRKKTKDEDSENDGPGKFKGKKRKTSFERELEKLEDSDYIDEDDEEMLNIRGASPSRWLDMFSDEEEDSYDGSEGGRGGRENMRGAGRGGRRGGRGFRGGRIDRNARRERIERLSSRGKRRGKGIGMRGGKKMGEDKDICIYHMQGKCHKGDDCPFSHDALPPRKMELCKFYLMDCCAKKDKCLYMHSEFPCKYFHTGLKCFAGKNCKFSHAKLTDDLRAILNKTYGLTCMSELTNNQQDLTGRPNHRQHLETAPKEILGDFPRHVREATRPMKKNKKIPSLFDVRISPPRDMQSDSDGNHTPMPSPTHQPNNKDFFRDSMEREHTPPPINDRPPRRGGSEHQPHHHHHHHHKNAASATESSSSHRSGSSRRPSGGSGAERRERRDRKAAGGRREDEGGRRLSPGEHQQHHHRHHHQHEGGRRQQSYSPPPARHQYEERDERPEEQQDEEEEEERVNERLKAPEPDQSSNDILSHLPKKQRELFLRIQQQQRQAENSQESNPEDDDQDNDYNKQEENWYSSEDEESTPLTTILKTINIQKTTAMAASGASMSPNQRHHHHHHQNNHHDRQTSDDRQLHESSSALPVAIPDINFGDVSALLSKVKQHFQTTADRSTKVRDPRLRPDSEPSEKQPHQQHSTGGNDSHARLHAPAQLSPSISAILNSAAGRAQHHQSSFSSPPSSHHHSSFGARSSPPSHHHSSASFGVRSSPPSHHHSSFGGRLSPPSHHHSSSSFGGPPSHHHSSSSSFPSRSSPPLSSYSRSAFPPATPMLNDDDDGDDDDNGISSPPPSSDDVNSISGLPFKPVPVHSAATEIDASINSHPPIVYRLVACYVSKPDYGAITTMPAGGALDPRWRKSARFNSGSGDETSRRDPRHRLADLPADPRHRTPNDASAHADPRHRTPNDATAHADPRHRLMPANQSHSMMAPPTPRYDDDPSHMGVRSGLMVGGGGTTPLPQMDVYCPPTPRLDADDTPPVRPTDPRQRHMSQQNQGMTSLYDQLRMQQQQQQFMPSQQSMMFDPSRPSMYGSDMPTNRQAQYNNYK